MKESDTNFKVKKMKINKSDTIQNVQEQFANLYKGLNIIFYKKAHDAYENSEKRNELSSSLMLKEVNANFEDAEIQLDKSMSVKAVEAYFEETLGLHIQVLRKSGDVWLQTSSTDDWTLQKQSEKAVI